MSTTVVQSSAFIDVDDMNVSGDAWEGVAEIKLEVNGCISFTVAGTPPAPAAPAGRRASHLSEDSWDGGADFIVRIDGEASGPQGQ
jgi:hypothetical protein